MKWNFDNFTHSPNDHTAGYMVVAFTQWSKLRKCKFYKKITTNIFLWKGEHIRFIHLWAFLQNKNKMLRTFRSSYLEQYSLWHQSCRLEVIQVVEVRKFVIIAFILEMIFHCGINYNRFYDYVTFFLFINRTGIKFDRDLTWC